MTTEPAARAALVAEARTWVGTPYHMNADIKGVGVDCGQLLIKIFENVGLTPRIATGHSPQDFHLNRSEERYLDFVRRYLTEFAGPPEPGDVMMFHYGLSYSHGAIVVETQPLTVVHALIRLRRVVEERLTQHSEAMRARPGGLPPRFFTLWPDR